MTSEIKSFLTWGVGLGTKLPFSEKEFKEKCGNVPVKLYYGGPDDLPQVILGVEELTTKGGWCEPIIIPSHKVATERHRKILEESLDLLYTEPHYRPSANWWMLVYRG